MSFDIRVERLLDTAPKVAFHHWIDPDGRRQWYIAGHGDWIVEAESDLRVGGRYHIEWGPSADQMYREEGVYEVVEPPHKLVYTAVHITPEEGPSPEMRVTVTFEPQGDRTLLTLVETGYPSAEIRDMVEKEFLPTGLDAYERTLPK